MITGYREAAAPSASGSALELPDGTSATGVAVDVDADGRLQLKLDDGTPKASPPLTWCTSGQTERRSLRVRPHDVGVRRYGYRDTP